MRDSNILWQTVSAHRCTLGESPVWDGRSERLLWVDITEGHVHEWYAESRRHIITKFPVKIGSIALSNEAFIIAASNKGFVKLDLENKKTEYIADPESHLYNNRFNDGKCDPQGRFWAGTMDDVSGKKEAGALYRLDKENTVKKMIPKVTCSNGLAWSGDCKTMYFIDSQEQHVKAFDFDPVNGEISNGRIVVSIPESAGIPDGMTIDREGMLWVALWGGSKVTRWDPNNGNKLAEIELPASQVTSCTFGGPDYKDLYITTAAIGLSDEALMSQPFAGSLFVVKNLPCGGQEPFRWKY